MVGLRVKNIDVGGGISQPALRELFRISLRLTDRVLMVALSRVNNCHAFLYTGVHTVLLCFVLFSEDIVPLCDNGVADKQSKHRFNPCLTEENT